jgi:tetratricopeptide (TPR) repeat protein
MVIGTQVPAAPAWARLPVDTYPADARAQITSARDAAVSVTASADTIGHLALVLHAWEQYDTAAQVYAEARRVAPRDATWWALAGTLASRMGRHDDAAEYFGRAAALAPSPLLSLRHADALLDAGRLEDARRVYTDALGIPEAEPAARYGLGRIAVADGNPSAARAHYERAVALVPTFGAAHYALAQLQRKAGDLDSARASIEKQQACLRCWPMPPDPWIDRIAAVRTDAAALLDRGLRSASRAEDARAIELHEEAVAANPALVQAHVNLITLYARTGNLPRAEAHYRAVLEAKTQVAEAHHAFGLALLALKEPTRGASVLQLAVEANPLDAEAHNALGLLHESSGRIAEAEGSYRAAVAADPRQRAMRFNLARVLVNTGRLAAAALELGRLLSPDDAEGARYAYAAATIAVRQGDLARGKALTQDALARARRHGQAELAAAIERDLEKLP